MAVQRDPGQDRLGVLEGLGLGGYLGRGYIALRDLGPASARTVAERSGIPQGRIYDVLERLRARGVVELLPEIPKRYRAVPFAQLLDAEAARLREHLDQLDERRQLLEQVMEASEAKPAAGGKEACLVVSGRGAFAARLARLVAEARSDVLLAGNDAHPRRTHTFRQDLVEAARRGVRVRCVVARTPATQPWVAEARALGIACRDLDPSAWPPWQLHVATFDEKVLLYDYWPEEEDRVPPQAVGLLVEGGPLARTLAAVAEHFWEHADPAGPAMAEPPPGLGSLRALAGERGPAGERPAGLPPGGPDARSGAAERAPAPGRPEGRGQSV